MITRGAKTIVPNEKTEIAFYTLSSSPLSRQASSSLHIPCPRLRLVIHFPRVYFFFQIFPGFTVRGLCRVFRALSPSYPHSNALPVALRMRSRGARMRNRDVRMRTRSPGIRCVALLPLTMISIPPRPFRAMETLPL